MHVATAFICSIKNERKKEILFSHYRLNAIFFLSVFISSRFSFNNKIARHFKKILKLYLIIIIVGRTIYEITCSQIRIISLSLICNMRPCIQKYVYNKPSMTIIVDIIDLKNENEHTRFLTFYHGFMNP